MTVCSSISYSRLNRMFCFLLSLHIYFIHPWERISALFATALGFVWGHYFGKAGAAAGAKADIEANVKDQETELKEFAEGIPV